MTTDLPATHARRTPVSGVVGTTAFARGVVGLRRPRPDKDRNPGWQAASVSHRAVGAARREQGSGASRGARHERSRGMLRASDAPHAPVEGVAVGDAGELDRDASGSGRSAKRRCCSVDSRAHGAGCVPHARASGRARHEAPAADPVPARHPRPGTSRSCQRAGGGGGPGDASSAFNCLGGQFAPPTPRCRGERVRQR